MAVAKDRRDHDDGVDVEEPRDQVVGVEEVVIALLTELNYFAKGAGEDVKENYETGNVHRGAHVSRRDEKNKN